MSTANVLERVCESCGGDLLPAMVRCRECGDRNRDRRPDGDAGAMFAPAIADRAEQRALRERPESQERPSRERPAVHEPLCPSCGESLRQGMARCRNCNWIRGENPPAACRAIEWNSPPSKPRPAAASELAGLDELLAEAEPIEVELPRTDPAAPAGPVAPTRNDGLIHLQCECGRKLRAPASRAGKSVRCPACDRPVSVPGGSPPDDTGQDTRPTVPEPGDADRYAKLAEAIERLLEEESSKVRRRRLPSGWKFSARKLKRPTSVATESAPRPDQTPVEHRDARRDAVAELAASKDSRAVETLVACLADESPKLRVQAAEGLGELGCAAGIPALVRLLGDSRLDLRKAAIEALGRIGNPHAIPPLLVCGQSDPHLKYLAASAIVAMKEAAVRPLIEALQSGDEGIVLEAVVLLGRLKAAKAIPALIEVLPARSATHRAHVAAALGQIGDERGAGPLAELLRDESAAVRANAAHGLSFVRHARAARALIAALRDPDEDVRLNAAWALAELGDERAADPLVRLLNDPSDAVRKAAAMGLGRAGDPRAVEPVLTILESEDEPTRLKAIGALKKLKDDRVIAALIPVLNHPKVAFRRRAADSLGAIGDAHAAAELERVLATDSATEARVAAARALGEIRDPGSIPHLEQALDDEFPVRCQAVLALGRMQDESVLPAVLKGLHDPMPEVRVQAAAAAAELGHRAVLAPLERLLEEQHEAVRRAAARALAQLGDERGEALVEQATRGPVGTGRRARRKLLAGLIPSLLLGLHLPAWLDTRERKMVAGGVAVATLLLAGGAIAWFTMSGANGEIVRRGNVASVSFSPDGQRVAVGRTGDAVQVWDVASRSLVVEQGARAGDVAFADDDTLAFSAGSELTLWKLGEPFDTASRLSGHRTGIVGMAVSDDRAKLVTRDSGGAIIRWDVPGARHEAAMQLPTQGIAAFALGPDGERVAIANAAGTIALFDIASAKKVADFGGNRSGDELTVLAFHPDGTRIAAGFDSGTIRLWSLADQSLAATLVPSSGFRISAIAFPTNGESLIATRGAQVDVWDLVTSRVRTVQTVAVDIAALAVSPDDRTLALGGREESEVYLYDLASGELKAMLDVE